MTPLGNYYRHLVWNWSNANYDLYLEGRGFLNEKEFVNEVVEDQHEYVVLVDGIPVAWFALQMFWERGEKLHLTVAPHAPMKLLTTYFRALIRYAKDRGARLFAEWPEDAKYDPARRLARLVGATEPEQAQQHAA